MTIMNQIPPSQYIDFNSDIISSNLAVIHIVIPSTHQ